MNARPLRSAAHCACLVAASLAAAAGRADSDEAWLHRAEMPGQLRPLLALLLDRSQATAAGVLVGDDYDPARDYGASLPEGTACAASRVYIRRGTDPMPDCGRHAGIELAPGDSASGLQCAAAREALAAGGYYIASRVAQWRDDPDGGHWQAPAPDSAGPVECRADRGSHGGAAGDWYAADGTGQPWTSEREREIAWDRPPFADAHVFLSGNFLNYLQADSPETARPIAEVLARRMAAALAATSELDVALIRVDDDGPDGGYVARANTPSGDAAAELLVMAQSTPAGSAPLAETLSEAARWLAGGTRRFGLDDRTDAASLAAPGAATYRSPFEHACRPVSLAFLTAGRPNGDDAEAAALALPRFVEETGGCGADCLATLGAWLAGTDLRDDLPGTQSAAMAWIAPAGGASPAGARSLADPLAFIDLVAQAHQRDAAVAADPQLSAAALMPFDARDAGPAVIFGLTAPQPRERWAGNALQYALKAPAGPFEPPLIVDREGAPAIGADGLPGPHTQSLWSDEPDANLLAGGAASRLPLPEERQLFVDVASERITDPMNRLEPGNGRIGRALLGLGALDPETADELIDSFRSLRILGDPGLSAAAIADYPSAGIRIAFVASQDGLLHAFDADSGIELWAWMPKELLARIPRLVRNAPTTARSHGIDGALVLHRHDPDDDGRIEPDEGEHLWLLFGLGRGGGRYYALDVSSPADPRLLWTVELPDTHALALAEPVVARLAIAGSGQDAAHWVVFLGGGYDRRLDAPDASGPGAGSALRIADALTGRILWSAGRESGDLRLAELSSVAAAPRVLDLDGDGSVDRAYALDVAGHLWRLDFENGRDAGTLASAHRLARLEGAGRRFHFTPDTSVVRAGTGSALAIAFGSGSRMRPRDHTVEDAFYVVYDTISGAGAPEVAATSLFEATGPHAGIPRDAPGWLLRLLRHGPGEKIAGPATTFDHVVRFQTYQPLPADPAAPCGPPRSVSRQYAIDIRTANPHATAVETEEDEPEEIPASGLPPGLRFGFPGRWDETCAGCRPRPFGILGGATFDTGYAGDPVRTSWRKLVPPDSR